MLFIVQETQLSLDFGDVILILERLESLGLLELGVQLIDLMGFLLKDEFEGVILALEFDAVGFFNDILLGKWLHLFLELEQFILMWI